MLITHSERAATFNGLKNSWSRTAPLLFGNYAGFMSQLTSFCPARTFKLSCISSQDYSKILSNVGKKESKLNLHFPKCYALISLPCMFFQPVSSILRKKEKHIELTCYRLITQQVPIWREASYPTFRYEGNAQKKLVVKNLLQWQFQWLSKPV